MYMQSGIRPTPLSALTRVSGSLKQQRSYKRIINLDKKIQIVIAGNRQNVEQGEDDRGKFYKVYYEDEE